MRVNAGGVPFVEEEQVRPRIRIRINRMPAIHGGIAGANRGTVQVVSGRAAGEVRSERDAVPRVRMDYANGGVTDGRDAERTVRGDVKIRVVAGGISRSGVEEWKPVYRG